MKHIKIVFLLFIMVIISASTIPVMAQETYPTNPTANPKTGKITIHTFQTIRNGFQNGPGKLLVASPASLVAAGGGCKTFTISVDGWSMASVEIWYYEWNTSWCYNGSTITSLSRWRSVWVNVGWSYRKDISSNKSGGVGKKSAWNYVQGDFCFLETYTCAIHSYPWVNVTVNGDGSYSASAGGH